MSELYTAQGPETVNEKRTQAWRTVGAVTLGAGLVVSGAAAMTTYAVHELSTMQVSVDPLNMNQDIVHDTTDSEGAMPTPTDIPAFDEAPRENPFLDGFTSSY